MASREDTARLSSLLPTRIKLSTPLRVTWYECLSGDFDDILSFFSRLQAYAYWKSGKINDVASFDLYFRKNPFKGEFTIFAGLTDCLKFLENFHYSETDISYLKTVLPSNVEQEFYDFLHQLTSAAKDIITNCKHSSNV